MKRLLSLLFNNVVVNNIFIFFGIDNYFKKSDKYWKSFRIIPDKTQQEIAGYSHIKEVQEVVDEIHRILKQTAAIYLKPGTAVLDIGCGPGLFLKDFKDDFQVHGIDLSANMLKLAKENNPDGFFYQGDFLTTPFEQKYSLIYSIGALQYFSKTDIEFFFQKIHTMLTDAGILFISYPHAISANDLHIPDLNYINYSPSFLTNTISSKFLLIQNKHVIDDREITDYDKKPYNAANQGMDKIYRNSSILIAQKKKERDPGLHNK